MKYLRQYKRVFIISLVLVCLLLMLVTSLSGAGPTFLGRTLSRITAPIQSGLMGVADWVSGRVEFLSGMSELHEENQRLRDLNSLLVMENSLLRGVRAENQILADLLETSRRYDDLPVMEAHVIAVDPGNWFNGFNIGRGANQGVERNMAVLVNGGLAGRVTQVWPNTARVEAIIDSASSVSAMVYRSGDIGVVRGDIELMMDGLALMMFMTLDVDINEGDEIQTSQFSTIYPSGITIGHVESVYHDPGGMTTAVIRPMADFSMVTHVLVITELFGLVAGD